MRGFSIGGGKLDGVLTDGGHAARELGGSHAAERLGHGVGRGEGFAIAVSRTHVGEQVGCDRDEAFGGELIADGAHPRVGAFARRGHDDHRSPIGAHGIHHEREHDRGAHGHRDPIAAARSVASSSAVASSVDGSVERNVEAEFICAACGDGRRGDEPRGNEGKSEERKDGWS